jgi:hypothetical protein
MKAVLTDAFVSLILVTGSASVSVSAAIPRRWLDRTHGLERYRELRHSSGGGGRGLKPADRHVKVTFHSRLGPAPSVCCARRVVLCVFGDSRGYCMSIFSHLPCATSPRERDTHSEIACIRDGIIQCAATNTNLRLSVVNIRGLNNHHHR